MLGQLCYDCAFKHLSCAWVAWTEVNNGYRTADHAMKVVGHMANAEEHLLEAHPKIAAEIREHRKSFWDALVCGMQYQPPFEELVERVLELAEEHLGEEDTSTTGDDNGA